VRNSTKKSWFETKAFRLSCPVISDSPSKWNTSELLVIRPQSREDHAASVFPQGGTSGDFTSNALVPELFRLHIPVVPMSTKAPVAASMMYIETLFEPELVT